MLCCVEQTSCSGSQDGQEGQAGGQEELELADELAVASELLGVISNHPLLPGLCLSAEGSGGGSEAEEGTGRCLLRYTRLLRTLLQYEEVFSALALCSEAAAGGSEEEGQGGEELCARGLQLLQSAAGEVKHFLRGVRDRDSPCCSSLEVSLPQR